MLNIMLDYGMLVSYKGMVITCKYTVKPHLYLYKVKGRCLDDG